MSKDFIADLLGNKNIYPVTVKEMVSLLRPLIDAYREESAKSRNIKTLQLLSKRVALLKKTEPKLFAQSRPYLRAKRQKLLIVILGVKFK